jgi:hypothetical protein
MRSKSITHVSIAVQAQQARGGAAQQQEGGVTATADGAVNVVARRASTAFAGPGSHRFLQQDRDVEVGGLAAGGR